jgi:hypothetical protein
MSGLFAAAVSLAPENRNWPQRTQSNAKRENEFGRLASLPFFFPAAPPYSPFFALLAFLVAIQPRNSGA